MVFLLRPIIERTPRYFSEPIVFETPSEDEMAVAVSGGVLALKAIVDLS